MDRFNEIVKIPVDNKLLEGELVIPETANSIIIFCHGSGSSRFSPRNKTVASKLREYNFGTLLFDLLTKEEDAADYYTRFNIQLLGNRLISVTKWLENLPHAHHCQLGYFGASTGAAAALTAASALPQIRAIVSRGGRPDLAANILSTITAPTLLIVGSLDHDVIAYNHFAYERLQGPKKLLIIEGAGHLFEEGNAMDKVAEDAAIWFNLYLQVHI
ncbi:dienelactone hydrolase family protein [Chitinophaga oryzae]|uniref:Dienelactone hydrolase family protein n=1 Tax=Chitinophaga oryzae TaxID=2725414 RepID=A0AAE6ZCG6_9BACT|nr:alpha/beta hydrolase [Chitinophaga oryzae]QJB30159.1 dienelactone hydrolase family protein [Chitinophaga oryzae]